MTPDLSWYRTQAKQLTGLSLHIVFLQTGLSRAANTR